MDIYINSYGTYIHKVGEMFELEVEGKKTKISPKKIKSFIISTHVQITTDIIELAVKNNIDIVLLDDFGNPYGRFWHSKFGSTAYIRRRQIEEFESENGLIYAKEWITNKIENSMNHLKELEYKRHSKAEIIEKEILEMKKYQIKIKEINGTIEEKRNTLMAYEGNASKHYYNILSFLIPKDYKFNGRSTRPAKDEFNCMLNYGFGVLYGKVEKALVIAGLDPFLGVLHTDNYNKKSLVFDFIENFRYLICKTVFKLFTRKQVNKAFFDKIYGGLKLNKKGKIILLREISEKLNKKKIYNNRKITNQDIIQFEAHKLANNLIKKEESEC
ncbi:MAG: CRISPR-associated endonuclease Cas1 [Fusobacteriia bacterium 4572_132]|nr:MAG: CRISPR-associated endonuclease Cas1 [Fusobacteriia bacterium 4572_132]